MEKTDPFECAKNKHARNGIILTLDTYPRKCGYCHARLDQPISEEPTLINGSRGVFIICDVC